MKKIFKYFGIFLSVAMMGAFTSCTIEEITESADLGLGIKVFFPTKVVAGQQMTINGSGFSDVREIVFPDGVKVSDFEIVSNDMIRVTAPAGIAAAGGKLIVRTADEEVESRLPLTLGSTVISGYSKQEGESIKGGEQITIYGKDLEFISSIELLDEDGNPLVLQDEDFYRKGTSSVIITLPRKVFDGSFVGKVYTFDGREFLMPELAYEPASDGGGHWETVITPIWENDGTHGGISWGSDYRFAPESNPTGEEIYTVPQDVWEKMKTETFYLLLQGEDPQVRVTTGWWSGSWCDKDFQPGNDDRLVDNGDGTWTLEINLSGDPFVELIDAQHLLFTGDRFTPLKLYFAEDIWVDGGGHTEIVKTPIWANDGTHGGIAWSSEYRFAPESNPTGEEIYTVPQDVWEKMKTETFYLLLQGEDPQVRVTTGWWSGSWCNMDFQPGNDDRLVDNGDGTWTLEISLADDPFVELIDAQHLLFTGDRFTPLELYFQEEIWVDGGGEEAKEVDIWANDGTHGGIAWSSEYRFAPESNPTGEEIYTVPQDVWDKMKSSTFYLLLQGEDPQVRVTTGWWSGSWCNMDFQPGNDDRLVDNGDGTWTLEISLADDPLVELIDAQHLLFTGDRYTPLKLYFLE